MEHTPSKRHITWFGIDQLIDKLADKVRHELPNIDSIYGIPRGGLIPAVLLAHKLDLPWSNVMLPNTLVVDDICDSGKTIRDSVGVHTATLYTKLSAVAQPTITAEVLVDESQWIVFPWESKNADAIQDYLK